MELFMDSLKTALTQGRHKEVKDAFRENVWTIMRLLGIAGLSFLLGRVTFFYTMSPWGTGLVTVLLARGKGNIYILPFILLGMLTGRGVNLMAWGDMGAAFGCALVFFILHKKKLNIFYRAAIACGITTAAKLIHYVVMGNIYIYDISDLAIELILLLSAIYVLHSFFELSNKASVGRKTPTAALAIISILVMNCVAGIGIVAFGALNLSHLAALAMVLIAGYNLGPLEGAFTGTISGTVLMLTASGSPALIGIFACGGVAAGFFKGYNQYLSGLCFAGVCIAFGLIKGYAELYLTVTEVLFAAAIFMMLPEALMEKIEILFAKVRQSDIHHEIEAKKQVRKSLEGYRDVFENLYLIYGKNMGKGYRVDEEEILGEENILKSQMASSRDVMALQFKGMVKAVDEMMEELARPKKTASVQGKPKFNVNVGVSAYAKEKGVSGDSFICDNISSGEYMMALSDGMGKGQRAAEESAVTVNALESLLRAGFDVEIALKIVNSTLLLRSNEEIFSTVDMGMLNLHTGRLRMFKIGAAATFLKREDRVDVIKVSGLPMGIVGRIPVESVERRLQRGDSIIILSDGITEADRGDSEMNWLKEAIEEIRSKDPQTMADLIVNKAVERYGVREKDDMTAIVVNVD